MAIFRLTLFWNSTSELYEIRCGASWGGVLAVCSEIMERKLGIFQRKYQYEIQYSITIRRAIFGWPLFWNATQEFYEIGWGGIILWCTTSQILKNELITQNFLRIWIWKFREKRFYVVSPLCSVISVVCGIHIASKNQVSIISNTFTELLAALTSVTFSDWLERLSLLSLPV